MRCLRPLRLSQRAYATPASTSPEANPTTIVLRPYQHECIQSCLDALASGSTRIGVSLPTGSGKTTVFLSLLSRIQPPQSNLKATRSLVIVNSIELARQSAEQAARLFPHWSVEIEQGTKHNATGLADLTVATYQTLTRSELERARKFDPSCLKAIIIDEAHHSAAPSYRKLLSQFDPNILHPERHTQPLDLPHRIPIIGFSATFSRHDGLMLGSVFEQIVYHRDFLDMVRDQWLCDIRFTLVKADMNLQKVALNPQTGDFNPRSLATQINTEPFHQLVVKSWIDRAAGRKSTLVFCVNIDHVDALTATFRSFGVDARSLDSQTNPKERKLLVSQFKEGLFPVLVNCGVLVEGADIPNIDCIVMARPTRSPNLYAQMIGRGMRLSPSTGKTDCRIMDFVDICSQLNIISLPTLFGLDPAELDEEVSENVETLEAKGQTKIARAMSNQESNYGDQETEDAMVHFSDPKYGNLTVNYVDHEDPFSLMDNMSGASNMFRLSYNAWVGCGDEIYVLPCLQNGDVRIQRIENLDGRKYYSAYFLPRSNKKATTAPNRPSYFRGRSILSAKTLAEAVKGCDTYVAQKVLPGTMVRGVLRTARWRSDPATEAQKKFVSSRWTKSKVHEKLAKDVSEDRINKLTKGEAANIITRLKHGAMSRYEKKMKGIIKEKMKELADKARLARFKVQVGPLTD